MANNHLKELPELVQANVLTAETAENIRSYYRAKNPGSANRLIVAFGILGALLSGLGIILIVAHNWDNFSRETKTLLAFGPLVLGQLACGLVLWKAPQNQLWRESAAAFGFLSIGATISMISQIYHIPGNLSGFLFTWSLLGLPLVYILRSGMASLLYVVGITYYTTQTGYWTYADTGSFYYWPMLAAILPFYYHLYRQNPESNFVYFLNWLVPLSIIIGLGTVADHHQLFLYIAYISLFSLYLQLGNSEILRTRDRQNNGYVLLGLVGTLILLLALSFESFWKALARENYKFTELLSAPEVIAATVLSLAAAWFLVRKYRGFNLDSFNLMEAVFLLFIIAFIVGYYVPLAGQILVNLLVLFLGLATIRSGARQNHLGILNFGLLIITALVVCRFFDSNLTFVTRGILFLLVGTGFFVANYYTLKTRKAA